MEKRALQRIPVAHPGCHPAGPSPRGGHGAGAVEASVAAWNRQRVELKAPAPGPAGGYRAGPLRRRLESTRVRSAWERGERHRFPPVWVKLRGHGRQDGRQLGVQLLPVEGLRVASAGIDAGHGTQALGGAGRTSPPGRPRPRSGRPSRPPGTRSCAGWSWPSRRRQDPRHHLGIADCPLIGLS